jgi:hypothetical protein
MSVPGGNVWMCLSVGRTELGRRKAEEKLRVRLRTEAYFFLATFLADFFADFLTAFFTTFFAGFAAFLTIFLTIFLAVFFTVFFTAFFLDGRGLEISGNAGTATSLIRIFTSLFKWLYLETFSVRYVFAIDLLRIERALPLRLHPYKRKQRGSASHRLFKALRSSGNSDSPAQATFKLRSGAAQTGTW